MQIRVAMPLRQFIVKVHSRCNLACDYCYVYTMADQRWRDRPRVMSRDTMAHTAFRIAEHARAHGLSSVKIVLHGGEPLLAGPAEIAHFASVVRAACEPDVHAAFSLQTNGTLLDADFLELLCDLDIRVGVSLDGDAVTNDQRRKDRSGAGTFASVASALRLLAEERFRPVYGGILCTVDVRADPVRTFGALAAFQPPAIDFLLPHGNWSTPPPGRLPGSPGTPYAEWLTTLFDHWFARPPEVGIRLFDEIIRVLLGGESRVEGVGLSATGIVVVETDGAIEQSDMLASAYHGAAVTGLHVRDDPFDAALELPDVLAGQLGAAGLPTACRGCPVRRVCGGGLRVHRYRQGEGFDNVSVYCPDLYVLIGHIRARLTDAVSLLRKESS